jgi:hypothetical protein
VSALIPFAAGGYAFLEGVFPYSQGVVALPGYAIERARFARPVPMAEGLRRIADFLAARAGASTLAWHYCRPPIEEIEFEMDLRGVSVERMLA